MGAGAETFGSLLSKPVVKAVASCCSWRHTMGLTTKRKGRWWHLVGIKIGSFSQQGQMVVSQLLAVKLQAEIQAGAIGCEFIGKTQGE